MLRQIIHNLATKYHMHPVLFISLTLITVVNVLARLINSRRKNKLSLAPYKYPFIGSTFDYYKSPHSLIKKLTSKYGPSFHIHFHGDVVAVVRAEDATEVFNHPDLNFMKSQNKYFSIELLHGSDANKYLRDVGTQALMKTLIPNLNGYGMSAYKEFLTDAKLSFQEDEFIVSDLGSFLKRFISRSSASMVVGNDLCRNEDMFYMFENSVSEIGKDFMPSPLRVVFPLINKLYMRYFYKKSGAIGKYRNITAKVLRANAEELKKRYVSHKKTCGVISYIMNEYFDTIDDEAIHTLTTIIIVYIFVAAHTTSEAITYVVYCLVKYPEYIQELREEQESLLSEFERSTDDEPIPTASVCRRMVKLDSFIQEALRIRKGGIGLAHTNISDRDVKLQSGVTIKPDEEVLINLWHVNFDENNQAPLHDLETFDGFRFVEKDTTATKSGQNNIIFGLGRHTCPGRWFAIYQIKSIVSYIIRNYDMSAVSDIKMVHSDNEYVDLPQGVVRFTKRSI